MEPIRPRPFYGCTKSTACKPSGAETGASRPVRNRREPSGIVVHDSLKNLRKLSGVVAHYSLKNRAARADSAIINSEMSAVWRYPRLLQLSEILFAVTC
jgi:hypothetical protein